MSCSITERVDQGYITILLENELIQAEILPELGGKIWNLRDLISGKQWLWHNPDVALRRAELGANYDDNWAGGWEELFPNDAGGEFMGKNLPDHGEWWSQSWQWEIVEQSPPRVQLRLWRDGLVTDTRVEKWISLDAGAARVSVRYRIRNRAPDTLCFLFKQHVSIAVTPSYRLELPGGRVEPVDLDFSTRIGQLGVFEWPNVPGKSGETVDLSFLPPPEEMHREFVYVSQLPAGWCGVRDMNTGASLRLHFPRATFPYTWLFMSFGGWRGLYTVVLEPCTNMPKDLKTAFDLGQCAALRPQEELNCELFVELSSSN
jgi:hypothetical protein